MGPRAGCCPRVSGRPSRPEPGGRAAWTAEQLGPTWVLVMQVVHVGDEAVVGQQEAHASQQHREVDAW